MPYIPKEDRPAIDVKVEILADNIVNYAMMYPLAFAEEYEIAMIRICKRLIDLELYSNFTECVKRAEEETADAIFNTAKKYGYRGAWLGGLNYALTRLVQVVPQKMVAKGVWKQPLKYWIYVLTAGAIDCAAIELKLQSKNLGPEVKNWTLTGVIGVLFDVKDEYKRRVNTAYEAEQIIKNGDCYDTPFKTVLVPAEINGVKGYQEVMVKIE